MVKKWYVLAELREYRSFLFWHNKEASAMEYQIQSVKQKDISSVLFTLHNDIIHS
jgi:hypothetical protein